ncbi:MAG TPA: YceI family protein [Acetobacteraceae bacterium]
MTLLPLTSSLVHGALLFGLAALTSAAPARTGFVFTIDQRYGSIGFSVNHLGLFSSHGRFDRFSGTLALDPDRPERTRFSMSIDAASLDMPWTLGATMLRGPNFFDVAAYPIITYASRSVVARDAQHYAIDGVLQVRGMERPQVLDAVLLNRQVDRDHHVETAEFEITGHLKRSDFGMVAQPLFISDEVTLTIQVRIELPHPAAG